MRVLNKHGDDVGSIFDFSTKDLSNMLNFKDCTLRED